LGQHFRINVRLLNKIQEKEAILKIVSLPGESEGFLRFFSRWVFVGGFGSSGLNVNNNYNDDNSNDNNGLAGLRKFCRFSR
jgi:hypothetical protein